MGQSSCELTVSVATVIRFKDIIYCFIVLATSIQVCLLIRHVCDGGLATLTNCAEYTVSFKVSLGQRVAVAK